MALRPKNGTLYQCIFCSYEGPNAAVLERHFEKEHYGNSNLFWCKFCGKAFDCVNDFFKHLAEDACKEVFVLQCGFEGCNYVEQLPSLFITHLKSTHRGKPLLPCKFCKRLFTVHSCFILHVQNECCNRPKISSLPKCTVPNSATTSELNCSQASKKIEYLHLPPNPRKEPEVTLISNPLCSKPVKKKSAIKKKYKRKKITKPIFHTEHSDSDVDDPTWNPYEDSERNDDSNVSKLRKNIKLLKEVKMPDLQREENVSPKPSESQKLSPNLIRSAKTGKTVFTAWEEWSQEMLALKSPKAITELLNPEHITHFFKCMNTDCSFSTNCELEFCSHVFLSNHEQRCLYCFSEFNLVEDFVKHIVSKHGNRHLQCSSCLYRSSVKSHAKLHKKEAHVNETEISIINCEKMNDIDEVPPCLSGVEIVERKSYICGVHGCTFTTLITTSFLNHLLESHQNIKHFSCAYCSYVTDEGVDIFVKHYEEHYIYDFECYYCYFGAKESQDVLRHMCINHPDSKIKILSRHSLVNEKSHHKNSHLTTNDDDKYETIRKSSDLPLSNDFNLMLS